VIASLSKGINPPDVKTSAPKISAIMPTYNVERYVGAAIESILHQTNQDWELIVIDDGSSDDTPRIIRGYAERDPRIHVILMGHKGRGETRNACLKVARGKYIAVCDSDDISLPERFERQADFLDNNQEIGVVSAHALYFHEDLEPCVKYSYPEDPDHIRSFFEQGRMGVSHAVAMFRRELLEAAGSYGTDFLTAEDLDLFLRFNEITRFQTLPATLLHYRNNPAHLGYGPWVQLCAFTRYAVYRRDSTRRGNNPLSFLEWKQSMKGLISIYLLGSLRYGKFYFKYRRGK
jgi:glycosyltransferase involved in cell wall biosynthesis